MSLNYPSPLKVLRLPKNDPFSRFVILWLASEIGNLTYER